jgi:hypothetical protein
MAEMMPGMSERIAVCQNPNGEGEYVPLDPGESLAPCFMPGCECVPVVFVREPQAGAVSTCPVCQGRGTVPFGYYLTQTGQILASGTGVETCRSCEGGGYVAIPKGVAF